METSRKVASRVEFEFPKASFLLDSASSSRVESRKSVSLNWNLKFHRYIFGRALIFKEKNRNRHKIKDLIVFQILFAKKMCQKMY